MNQCQLCSKKRRAQRSRDSHIYTASPHRVLTLFIRGFRYIALSASLRLAPHLHGSTAVISPTSVWACAFALVATLQRKLRIHYLDRTKLAPIYGVGLELEEVVAKSVVRREVTSEDIFCREVPNSVNKQHD